MIKTLIICTIILVLSKLITIFIPLSSVSIDYMGWWNLCVILIEVVWYVALCFLLVGKSKRCENL